MKNTSKISSGQCLLLNGSLLLVALTLASTYYPALATLAYGILGDEVAPGSSMGYFRDHYVLPGSIVLAACSLAALAIAASRSHTALHRVVIAAWTLIAAALLGSSIWYFRTLHAASSYRG